MLWPPSLVVGPQWIDSEQEKVRALLIWTNDEMHRRTNVHVISHKWWTTLCSKVQRLKTKQFADKTTDYDTFIWWVVSKWSCQRTGLSAKHFCFILSTGTRIWTDSVMHPWSSSRGRNTSASCLSYSYSCQVLCTRQNLMKLQQASNPTSTELKVDDDDDDDSREWKTTWTTMHSYLHHTIHTLCVSNVCIWTRITCALECKPVQTAAGTVSPSERLLGKPWSCRDEPWSRDSLGHTLPVMLNTQHYEN